MNAVLDELQTRGVDAEEIHHDAAHTALGEAARLGVPADEVAKTVVLDTHDGHALAVIPASERLDMGLVQRALGDSHAHLTSEDQLQRDYPQYELGAFPPLGSLLHAAVYVDPRVMEHPTIVFAAGTATVSLRARTADVFRDEAATVTPLVKTADEEDKDPVGP
jgi:prolyl-tRNA editing enzyme YbaK/EbsC (Cys-tRNA(Pro) deacylase)